MMQIVIIFLVISQFLCFGCTSSGKDFKTFYDSKYEVIDRGGKNVIVKSRACSIFPKQAIAAARRTAEYHLRSVIGFQNHKKEFNTINHYNDGLKTCVEISARGFRSL